jgi:hypothetical protein
VGTGFAKSAVAFADAIWASEAQKRQLKSKQKDTPKQRIRALQ